MVRNETNTWTEIKSTKSKTVVREMGQWRMCCLRWWLLTRCPFWENHRVGAAHGCWSNSQTNDNFANVLLSANIGAGDVHMRAVLQAHKQKWYTVVDRCSRSCCWYHWKTFVNNRRASARRQSRVAVPL